MNRLSTVLVVVLSLAHALLAAEHHVSPEGAATGSGSAEQPFGTIRQAADAARPGDTVLIHAGIYRESVLLTRSGEPGKPIIFTGVPGEQVVLSGADPLRTDWSSHTGKVFKTKTAVPVQQVLRDEKT